jgi:hypothetical protein
MTQYNIKKNFGERDMFFHRIDCQGGDCMYYWSIEKTGALAVNSRSEAKSLIKEVDARTSIKELNFVKVTA